MAKNILYGDIGGTKTLITLASIEDGHCHITAQQRFASNQFPSFDQLLYAFCRQTGIDSAIVDAACFGVAGPVVHSGNGDQAKVTNLPWQLDSVRLEQRFDIEKIRLINDVEAVGYGISTLGDHDVHTLQTGRALAQANCLVIGAGTGLGVAVMVWCDGRYRVMPTEGGHVDFAPVSGLQCELYRFLAGEQGRVACEHVLSGPGLVNIYRFLHHYHQGDETVLTALLAKQDPGAAIALAADEGNRLAEEAVTLLVDVYGAQAGNYALATMARGGVYVAGGIAPKLLVRLQTGRFLEQFNNKGKMADLMKDMPVKVVLDSNVGLHGARQVVCELATP